jgi:hypothetical protein
MMDFSIGSAAELFNESDEHVARLLLKQYFSSGVSDQLL